MANVYIRSGAGGTADGSSWANAYLLLGTALSAKAAGDDFWVSEDHAEVTAGAVTLTCPGTVGTPCRIICVNHAGTVPPVSADLLTTATISTTGANAITVVGFFYCYGIIFQAASTGGAVTANINLANIAGNYQRYDTCIFKLGGTSGGQITASLGSAGSLWNNCSVRFAAAAETINGKGRFTWQNSPAAIDGAGTLPTNLFSAATGVIFCEGVDFSALASKILVPTATNLVGNYYFKDCKYATSGTPTTVAATQTGGIATNEIYVIRSDASNVASNYRQEKYSYAGTLTTETSIVNAGGASDGSTPISWKVATPATGPTWHAPFTCFPITVWNDSTASTTITVEGNGAAIPTKEQAWIDVEYFGSASNPMGSFVTSGNADVLATAAGTSSSASWAGGTSAFKMSATFTPGQKGPITVWVRIAKANSTFYIDPVATLS